MWEHWTIVELLAKDRQAEYLRQRRQIELAEYAARTSGDAGSLIWRLLAAWSGRLAFALGSRPALTGQEPQ